MAEYPKKRWEVTSGFAAQMLGRAATFGKYADAPNVRISHSPDLPTTNDEVAFYKRTVELGPLVLSVATTRLAEEGLRSIIASNRIYRNIRPQVATLLLEVLDGPPKAELIMSPQALAQRIDEFYPPELAPLAAELSVLEVQNVTILERAHEAA